MAPSETNELLRQEYSLRFAGIADYRVRVWSVLTAFFSRWIPSTSAVLDLGCGWGEFINQIAAREKYGMDLNPESRSKLSGDVKLLQQDCSKPWALPPASLDVVFTSNFFEHLPDKPSLGRTLDQAHRCLKDGGRLICLGPNIRYLAGAYWDFWDHYVPLSDRSLAEALQLAGFAIEYQKPRFLPYSMSQGFQPPIALLRAYLMLPIVWPLFGKQFLIVAQKTTTPNSSR